MVEPCSAGWSQPVKRQRRGKLFCLVVVLLEWVDSTLPKAPTQCRWLFISTRPACPARTASVPVSQRPQRPNSPIARPNSNPTPPFPAPNRSGPVSKPFLIPLGAVSALSQSENHPYPEPWSELRPNTSANSSPAQGNSCRPSAPLAHSLQPCSRILPPPFEFQCIAASLHHLRGPILLSLFFVCCFVFSLPAATLIHTRSQISLNHGHPARPVDQVRRHR